MNEYDNQLLESLNRRFEQMRDEMEKMRAGGIGPMESGTSYTKSFSWSMPSDSTAEENTCDERVLREKDAVILELKNQLKNKDKMIMELSRSLSDKDDTINHLKQVCEAREKELGSMQEKDELIKNYEETIVKYKGYIQTYKNTVAELKAQLEDRSEMYRLQAEQNNLLYNIEVQQTLNGMDMDAMRWGL